MGLPTPVGALARCARATAGFRTTPTVNRKPRRGGSLCPPEQPCKFAQPRWRCTNRRGELCSPADGQGCPSLRVNPIRIASTVGAGFHARPSKVRFHTTPTMMHHPVGACIAHPLKSDEILRNDTKVVPYTQKKEHTFFVCSFFFCLYIANGLRVGGFPQGGDFLCVACGVCRGFQCKRQPAKRGVDDDARKRVKADFALPD